MPTDTPPPMSVDVESFSEKVNALARTFGAMPYGGHIDFRPIPTQQAIRSADMPLDAWPGAVLYAVNHNLRQLAMTLADVVVANNGRDHLLQLLRQHAASSRESNALAQAIWDIDDTFSKSGPHLSGVLQDARGRLVAARRQHTITGEAYAALDDVFNLIAKVIFVVEGGPAGPDPASRAQVADTEGRSDA